jgi:CRP-like cAMP-binding protein
MKSADGNSKNKQKLRRAQTCLQAIQSSEEEKTRSFFKDSEMELEISKSNGSFVKLDENTLRQQNSNLNKYMKGIMYKIVESRQIMKEYKKIKFDKVNQEILEKKHFNNISNTITERSNIKKITLKRKNESTSETKDNKSPSINFINNCKHDFLLLSKVKKGKAVSSNNMIESLKMPKTRKSFQEEIIQQIQDKTEITKIKKRLYSSNNMNFSTLKYLGKMSKMFDEDFSGSISDNTFKKQIQINLEQDQKKIDPDKEKQRVLKKIDAVISDSLSSEEVMKDLEEDNEGSFLIYSDSIFKIFWDFFMVLLTFYSLIFTPIQLAFGINDIGLTTLIFNLMLDLFYIIDVFINFFVPYENFEENLIKNYKLIALNYLTTWFIWDVLACLPTGSIIGFIYYEMIQTESSNITTIKEQKIFSLNQVVRFAKFYRLMKLSQFIKVMKIVNEKKVSKFTNMDFLDKINMPISNAVKRFLKFIFGFLLITHILACIWIYLGTLGEPNWIFRYGYQDSSDEEMYVSSIYFIMYTILTIGYGDISPVNSIERFFVILIMLVGVLLYSFAVSSLGNILTSYDKNTAKYNQSLQLLNEIKIKHRVPDAFYEKVAKFINYDHKFNKIEQFVFINELPAALKHLMLNNMYDAVLKNFKFFKFEDEEFKSKVLLSLRPVQAYRKEYICVENENLEEFFLVRRGILSITLGKRYNEARVMEIRRTEHFGDILIMAQQKSPVNVKVISNACDLFYINKSDLIEISTLFPQIWEKIFLISTYNYLIMLERVEKKINKIENEEKKMDYFKKRQKLFEQTQLNVERSASWNSSQTFKKSPENKNFKLIESFKRNNLENIQRTIKELPKLFENRKLLKNKTFMEAVNEKIKLLSVGESNPTVDILSKYSSAEDDTQSKIFDENKNQKNEILVERESEKKIITPTSKVMRKFRFIEIKKENSNFKRMDGSYSDLFEEHKKANVNLEMEKTCTSKEQKRKSTFDLFLKNVSPKKRISLLDENGKINLDVKSNPNKLIFLNKLII